MTNHEIARKLEELAARERKITNEILQIIIIAMDRRTYLELGFPSMFEWLVRGFGYSNGAAYRRIEAAKVLKAVPDATKKLQEGRVNLSTLSKAQNCFKNREKKTGHKVQGQEKRKVLQKLENKSQREAEQILASLFPEAQPPARQDRRTVVDENTTRLSVNLTNETMNHLQRAKEVLSHKLPEAKDADVIAYALEFLLEKIDPLRKSTSAAEVNRAATIKHSEGKCTYKDPKTGQVCGSRYQIEVDHIVPKALGGRDTRDNLRALCRKHNLFMAQKILGEEFMRKFMKPK